MNVFLVVLIVLGCGLLADGLIFHRLSDRVRVPLYLGFLGLYLVIATTK